MDAIETLREIYTEATTDVDSIDRHEAAAVISSIASMARPFVDEPTSGLETPRMLVLSTSHLTERTAQRLSDVNTYIGRPSDLPVFYPKGEYGWIIPIIGSVEETCDGDPIPAELRAILEFAHAAGCTWVMLDRDADVVDGLPTYDW